MALKSQIPEKERTKKKPPKTSGFQTFSEVSLFLWNMYQIILFKILAHGDWQAIYQQEGSLAATTTSWKRSFH